MDGKRTEDISGVLGNKGDLKHGKLPALQVVSRGPERPGADRRLVGVRAGSSSRLAGTCESGGLRGRVVTDPHAANIARVYDALLGGKDNYEADREARDRLAAQAPEISQVAMDNRLFMMRAARFLAGSAGISQFVDFGTCLPIGENMHEVVQRLNHEATVVYVGIDPLVIAHGRALLADNEQTHMVEIDWRRPENVLADAALRRYVDFDQPVAIFQVATLNHIADEYDPARIMSVHGHRTQRILQRVQHRVVVFHGPTSKFSSVTKWPRSVVTARDR
ncbi:SAM-dependent methyltransferase [Kibdelosporangium lantanae]|uniref:SAM-dependent methyltransferase n=1 Tax=Kibdelosporangium lantanae TaxID=1497396 RepID=A0ABW3M6R6_9PSEU